MTLYIFNPEHDLCLANGDPNYVPPTSALDFAKKGKKAMNHIYGGEALVLAADECKEWHSANPDTEIEEVIAWGWDRRVCSVLRKSGIVPTKKPLPDEEFLRLVERYQHRTSVLALQSHAAKATSVEEVVALVERHHKIVLKAPLSGSGRGLRWVTDHLSGQDIRWIEKTVASQDCVIVEKRIEVANDFAIEFIVRHSGVECLGLSLFVTQSGVYRHNIMLPDNEIRRLLDLDPTLEQHLQKWLYDNLSPWYEGPAGFDIIRDTRGHFFISELNLRHTMGMVAHNLNN